ncbi:unnamed protein product [Macrosiphum euphorbiae]|uniref:Uncharacterized protein n=1 Tax=Macrosiphum euphorbiae TaxID=13131 RepID=A0AAV0VVU3_9HEMI|nr:unnamed protein product [Macrosiphum euphorbiae]
MNENMFNTLLEMVNYKIQRQNSVMRMALPAKLKLQIACRYLATGDSLATLQYMYRVPKCSISKFLPEVFDAIYEALKNYIEVPKNQNEWKNI